MFAKSARVIRLAALAGSVIISPAAADDCKPLGMITSVDLVPGRDKRAEYVPVEINGTPKQLLLDTGAAYSTIDGDEADALHLSRQTGNFELYNVQGEASHEFVDADLAIGRFKARVAFPITPGETGFKDPVAGILGPDILAHFDISVDFGSDKLDILSQDHCEGKVVYWPHDALAVLPITLLASRHIVIPVTLDGKNMYALLDSGAFNSTLTIPAEWRYFDLKLGSADAPQRGNLTGDPQDAVYHHVFASLDLNGIAVSNPDVDIIPDKLSSKIDDSPPTGTRLSDPRTEENKPVMLIGMDVLRHLHIYIAYKEEKLYITPASAPAPLAAPTPPSPP